MAENLIKRGFWHYKSFRCYLTWVLCFALIAIRWGYNTLGMAMVCMVNGTAVSLLNMEPNVTFVDEENTCGLRDLGDGIDEDYGGDIVWTSHEQGLLFSAISWGGAIVILPGGWLINRYGAKRIVAFCLLITLVCTVLTPVAAEKGGLWPTFFARFFMGFGGKILVDTAATVTMAHWIPPTERSTAMGIYTSGYQIPVALGMLANSALCKNPNFFSGWPAIFYVSGLIALVATALWVVFIDDTPAESRWLSNDELHYIKDSLMTQNLGKKKVPMDKIPWRRLLLSHAVWCCVAVLFCDGLMDTVLIGYTPTYLKEVLRVDLHNNGLYSAFPFLVQLVSKMIFVLSADALKKHTKISHTIICKGYNCLGTIAMSTFIIALGFMNCERVTTAIVLISMSNVLFAGLIPGVYTALMCFAPAYTGVISAMSYFSYELASIVAPYIVGALTNQHTVEQWRVVFSIMGGSMSAAGIYFLFAGAMEIQDWAKVHPEEGIISNGTMKQSAKEVAAIAIDLSDGQQRKMIKRMSTIAEQNSVDMCDETFRF